jgi:SAM-dependent methyltransferase
MSSVFKTISSCEVCGNKSLSSVLDLGNHPMCDDLVRIGDSRSCVEYPIEILLCKKCGTAHQHFQVPKLELFPDSYHYRSRFTADVLSGMKDLVQSCVETFGDLSNKQVLDIGCNDGSLLGFFRDKGANTFGIEPTAAAEDCRLNGHTTYQDYLSQSVAESFVSAHGHPDFIVFTNVFAHIDNLAEVIESLKVLLSPETVIVIENHYIGSVLNGNQFDTFYHEHPRTYSFNSFKCIAQSLHLSILNLQFPSRYVGNR